MSYTPPPADSKTPFIIRKLPTRLHQYVKVHAALKGISMQDFIIEILTKHVPPIPVSHK